LIEAGLLLAAEDADGFQEAQCPQSVSIGRIFRGFERHLHVRLRGQIVDFVRLSFLHDTDDVGGIGHIAVMQMKCHAFLVRIMNKMIETLGIEGR
jgi:hypothetical protein